MAQPLDYESAPPAATPKKPNITLRLAVLAAMAVVSVRWLGGMPWLDSLRDNQLKVIWGILGLAVMAIAFLLGVAVAPGRRKSLFLWLALGGIPIGLQLDGGIDSMGPPNCSCVGLPMTLVFLAAIGIACRAVFDWLFGR